MFRKKQLKILRVKDGKKRLSNADSDYGGGELTYSSEVLSFLKNKLNLDSVHILDGSTIYIPDPDYCVEFDDYFWDNEMVDILVPKEVDLDGWELRESAYYV